MISDVHALFRPAAYPFTAPRVRLSGTRGLTQAKRLPRRADVSVELLKNTHTPRLGERPGLPSASAVAETVAVELLKKSLHEVDLFAIQVVR